MTIRARWAPGWYNLDASLKVGRQSTFAFSRLAPRGFDAGFLNGMLRPDSFYYASAVVEAIEHGRFGALTEVDTRPFGQYTFTRADGGWVTIEAEENLGHVNASSPGFPVTDCDPAWADDDNDGWALTVVLSGFIRTERPD